MGDGQHIRNGLAGFGNACEDNAAGTVLYAVLATDPRLIPLEVGVPNDLPRLGKRKCHPLAIKSFRGCSEWLPPGCPHCPMPPVLRR